MICEKCNKEHDGKYGSGRFCSSKCARSFSTSKNRKEINQKISQKLKNHRCIKGGTIQLCDYGCGQLAKYKFKNGKWCCENAYSKCKKIRQKNSDGLKKAHLEGRARKFTENNRLKGNEEFKKNLEKNYQTLLFEEKPLAERYRIVLKEQDNKCLICGIEQWQNKPLKLHLDHIDGNTKNNTRENLRYLCPNCHSQTPTYCQSGNRKGKIYGKKVSDEKLIKTIQKTTSVHQTLIKCDLAPKGRNYHRIYNLIVKHKLEFRT